MTEHRSSGGTRGRRTPSAQRSIRGPRGFSAAPVLPASVVGPGPRATSKSAINTGIVLGLGGLFGLVALILSGSPALCLVAAALPSVLVLGVWRSAVGLSVMASVLHNGEQATLLPEFAWYALQFGPLLAAIPASFLRARAPLRAVDRALTMSLGALTVLALSSSLWSAQPTKTAQQGGLFILVAAFLISTVKGRWTDTATVRGDVTFLFAILGAINLAGVMSGLDGAPAAFGNYGRFQGLMSNPNYAGILAAVAIALGVYLLAETTALRRLMILGLFVIHATTLLWSGSRGALAALVLALVAISLGRAGRRVRRLTLGLGLLAAVVVPLVVPVAEITNNVLFTRADKGVDVTSGRLQIWASLLHKWQEQPILGTGFRTIEEINASTGLVAHNIYLSFLVELGLVGIAIFGIVVVSTLAAGARQGTSALLLAPAVTVLAIELTESSIHGFGNATALTSWIALLSCAGAGRAAWIERQREAAAGLGALPNGEFDMDLHHASSPGPSPARRRLEVRVPGATAGRGDYRR